MVTCFDVYTSTCPPPRELTSQPHSLSHLRPELRDVGRERQLATMLAAYPATHKELSSDTSELCPWLPATHCHLSVSG